MYYSNHTIAVPPGATIKEQLDMRGLTQKEFASRMGMSEKHISNLINGKAELTQEVALRLESIFGIPARFWNNLESLYRESIARVNAENDLEEDAEIADLMPYSELVKLGWIIATRDRLEKTINLRNFFEISRLSILRDQRVPGLAFRKLCVDTEIDYKSAIWVQKARLEARKIQTGVINGYLLQEKLSSIRAMTTQDPEVFCKDLVATMADCGIALVFLPHIGGSFLHGATFVDGKKIVLGLTVRGKYADKFWFSLFHEIGHVINGHVYETGELTEEQEAEANNFARDALIPLDEFENLIKTPLSPNSIQEFSARIGIHPGIVVGRLQKEEVIPFGWYNEMKLKYQIN